jgi:hypothetical protein
VPGARDARTAEWIVSQASRAFICGSDVVVMFSEADWEMEPGGRRVGLESPWCNQDVLATGNLTMPELRGHVAEGAWLLTTMTGH